MNDAKYSILFMRDDLDVRRFRINPFWLKAIFACLSLLIVLAVAGIYFGITSVSENLDLTRENNRLSRQLDEAELRLTTLGNMEKILESYDTRELQSLLSGEQAEAGATKADPKADPKAGEKTPPAVNLAAIFAKTDTGAVRLEDISLQIKKHEVLVSFNLLNNLNNTQLSGDTRLALVTNDGQVVELAAKNADLSFQIQRRKPIRATVPIPENLNPNNVFGLRLTVTREDGKVVFSETYPQSRVD